jgi:hypothetical protein
VPKGKRESPTSFNKFFFVATLLLYNHHRDNMRQPDMASSFNKLNFRVTVFYLCIFELFWGTITLGTFPPVALLSMV